MPRWTEQDLSKFEEQSGRKVAAPKSSVTRLIPPKPRKYRNEPVIVDDIRFDSKLESRRYVEIKALQAVKRIQYFLMQVPFRLPGGIIYRADFQIFWGNDIQGLHKVTYEDCHGADTRVKTNKLKQVKALYKVDVILVREAGT